MKYRVKKLFLFKIDDDKRLRVSWMSYFLKTFCNHVAKSQRVFSFLSHFQKMHKITVGQPLNRMGKVDAKVITCQFLKMGRKWKYLLRFSHHYKLQHKIKWRNNQYLNWIEKVSSKIMLCLTKCILPTKLCIQPGSSLHAFSY